MLRLVPTLTRGPARIPSTSAVVRGTRHRDPDAADSSAEFASACGIDSLLNALLREFPWGTLVCQRPEGDPSLAAEMDKCASNTWLRVNFAKTGRQFCCPLRYVSSTGKHAYAAPCLVRREPDGRFDELGLEGLLGLIADELRAQPRLSEGGDLEGFKRRVLESRDNLERFGERWGMRGPSRYAFLAAEQALVAGSPFQPCAKSRLGFDELDLQRYSPELQASFRLHYFLVRREHVIERHVPRSSPLFLLSESVRLAAGVERGFQVSSPEGAVLLPVHPWEAGHLLQDPRVQRALDAGGVRYLGEAGPEVAATSNVSTVYTSELPYMLALSLHVEVGDTLRVNRMSEMKKSLGIARLLASSFGRELQKSLPHMRFLCDYGLVSVELEGEPVDGFSTLFRDSPIRQYEPWIAAAALIEPGGRRTPLLAEVTERFAEMHGISRRAASHAWLARYLALLVENILPAYTRFGVLLEANLERLLVELDAAGMPTSLCFRETQGIYFGEAAAPRLLKSAPELVDAEHGLLPTPALFSRMVSSLLVDNVLSLVQAFGSLGLCDERDLLQLLHVQLKRAAVRDTTGFVGRILRARVWPARAQLALLRSHDAPAGEPLYAELASPIHGLGTA
jgi:siderophore synthetase component